MRKFYRTEVLDDGYQLVRGDKCFCMPAVGNFDDYLCTVKKLPVEASPEVFGMHQNAAISFQTKETNEMISNIVQMAGGSGNGTGGSGGGEESDQTVLSTI